MVGGGRGGGEGGGRVKWWGEEEGEEGDEVSPSEPALISSG